MKELGPDISIPKTTGTHADVLVAAGLADLLSSAMDNSPLTIIEEGTQFIVHLPRALSEVDIVHIPSVPGYPFLKANENVAVPSGIVDMVDYKAEKAKADRIKKISAKPGRNKNLDAESQQLIQEENLRQDWRLLQVLNTLKGSDTTNRLYGKIIGEEPTQFQKKVFAALYSLVAKEPSRLDWKVSLVQLFTPVAAKGYSRLKPDSTGRNDKTKEQWVEPIVEWLKYRGYFLIACPFFQGAKAEDIRLLCPIPRNISIGALTSLAKELPRKGVYGAAPKMDALAILRLAELLIRRSREYQNSNHNDPSNILPPLDLGSKSPSDIISGIAITHYQSMGSAKVISTMSTLSLPGWFPISSHDDAQKWLNILDEHQKIIRGLKDDRSDEVGLLVAYRRFLERRGGNAAWALVEFMEHYGPFIMRANGSDNGRRRIARFTDEYFRRIIMGMNGKLLEIINDPGFESVARAVRQATVNAQNKKAREKAGGEKVWREVRYELLHDLSRTRKVPGNAFTECVAEFVSRYNSENARRREVTGDMRTAPPNVSDEEFKSFVGLIDYLGASTVGALLCAYGSCKEKWEPEEPETKTETVE